ncbi:hypothetical protein HNQ27_09420 [Pseudomonas sp. B11D7D]|nr:hypothetical protein [Pseudomonas sp. B11D7D]QNH08407.1 hypothetical protein HNQ27_09420 [Pseudomonas sp. B11D7D]
MASKPNTARQHKYFAVLIDVDNPSAAIAESLIESNEMLDKLRVFLSIEVRDTLHPCKPYGLYNPN